MRAPSHRPARSAATLAAVVTVGAVALAGCSSDTKDASSSAGPSASRPATSSAAPSASSTAGVPAGVDLTDQGSRLSFGDPARVAFETTDNRASVLQLTVRGVRRGRIADFKGFILDDSYKKQATYYYARVRVRNVGEGDVGGVGVPLWGVNAANTLLPAVNFTAGFRPCPSRQLPAKFPPGAALTTCLVFLSPDRGTLEGVSYRPSQQYDPITWTGPVTAPATPAGSAGPSGSPEPRPGGSPAPGGRRSPGPSPQE